MAIATESPSAWNSSSEKVAVANLSLMFRQNLLYVP